MPSNVLTVYAYSCINGTTLSLLTMTCVTTHLTNQLPHLMEGVDDSAVSNWRKNNSQWGMKLQYRKRKQDSNGWRLTTLVSMPMCSLAPTVAGLSPAHSSIHQLASKVLHTLTGKTLWPCQAPLNPWSRLLEHHTSVIDRQRCSLCVTKPWLTSCLGSEATCYVRAICCWMVARDHHP